MPIGLYGTDHRRPPRRKTHAMSLDLIVVGWECIVGESNWNGQDPLSPFRRTGLAKHLGRQSRAQIT